MELYAPFTAQFARKAYRAILSYSRRLGPDALLVADLIREQELEAGIRWALDPRTVFSFRGGPGFGEDSPQWQVTLGLQYSF